MAGNKISDRIRDYYEDPYHRGQCDRTTHSGESRNERCGDVVAVEVRVIQGRIEEIWFDGEGCQLSQGAASIYAEFFEGSITSDVLDMSDAEVLSLVGANEPRACTLLGFRAICEALQNPIDDNDEHDDPTFGGPDLGAEC